tara:strand:- start:37 stop:267 length:231 start_codon:yes stop_codon:yes gene_type:complete
LEVSRKAQMKNIFKILLSTFILIGSVPSLQADNKAGMEEIKKKKKKGKKDKSKAGKGKKGGWGKWKSKWKKGKKSE